MGSKQRKHFLAVKLKKTAEGIYPASRRTVCMYSAALFS
jgi:hypothetical protein